MQLKLRYKYPSIVFFDIVFIATALALSLLIKGSDIPRALVAYQKPIAIFVAVWILGSVVMRKYTVRRDEMTHSAAMKVLRTNVLLLLIVAFVIFLLQQDYSRGVLLGVALFTTVFEMMATYAYTLDAQLGETSRLVEEYLEQPAQIEPLVERSIEGARFDDRLRDTIIEESGEKAFLFIRKHLSEHPGQSLFVSTTTKFNIDTQPDDVYQNITNLHRVNDIQWINKFFESINTKIPV
ncbi:MAG: hypothetical protein WC824_11400, partial [Bacteroidota bacterium]